MPPITPVRREDAPELEDVFARAEKALGFIPISFFILARRPETARAFSRLSREVIGVPNAIHGKEAVCYIVAKTGRGKVHRKAMVEKWKQAHAAA